MTFRRDFKKRIRQRQSETGERYTTARERLLARDQLVIELREVDAHPGILCPIRVTPSLWAGRQQHLEQLREILLVSGEGLEPMRRVVLFGERERTPLGNPVVLLTRLREFRQGLERGLRGPGVGGRVLAFDARQGGITVIAQLLPRHDQQPILILSAMGEVGMKGIAELWPWVQL